MANSFYQGQLKARKDRWEEDGQKLVTNLESILAFCAHISGHADHKLRHQAKYCVLCRMDGARNVETARIEDIDCQLRNVKPHLPSVRRQSVK